MWRIYGLYSSENSEIYYYVGQTSRELEERLKSHLRESRRFIHTDRPLNKEKNEWIISVLNGGCKVEIKCLQECSTQQEADEAERAWIYYFSGEHPLTNIQDGGISGYTFKMNEEQKKKISFASSNRSEEQKKKMREIKIGRKTSSDTIEKIRKAQMGKIRANHSSFKIGQYDMDGNLIASFNGPTEAQSITGIPKNSICRCVHGYIDNCYGFIWKYTKEKREYKPRKVIDPVIKERLALHMEVARKNRKNLSTKKRKIGQYEMDGTFVKEHPSISAAAREVGCSSQGITYCLSGQGKSCYGYFWKYENEIK